MPQVPIVHTAWGPTRENTMGMKVEGEPIVSFITTPPQMTGSPGTWNISETERPGRQAVTQASSPGLRTLSFEHKIASHNPYESIEHFLLPFRAAAEKGKRVQFIGGGWLPSGTQWWIRSLNIAEDLKAANNQTSRATLTWECVEANRVTAVELTKTGVRTGRVTVIRPGTVTIVRSR